jgi:hypothetical protein
MVTGGDGQPKRTLRDVAWELGVSHVTEHKWVHRVARAATAGQCDPSREPDNEDPREPDQRSTPTTHARSCQGHRPADHPANHSPENERLVRENAHSRRRSSCSCATWTTACDVEPLPALRCRVRGSTTASLPLGGHEDQRLSRSRFRRRGTRRSPRVRMTSQRSSGRAAYAAGVVADLPEISRRANGDRLVGIAGSLLRGLGRGPTNQ